MWVHLISVEHRLSACRFQWLWCVGSVVAAPRLQGSGLLVVAHGLSCLVAQGNVPRLGIEQMSLESQGIFLTTRSPGEAL